ncbi:MAG: hypothetical protein MZV65_11255 [Chromatiales bacterium]|nr:hypothetical protein [Chromatiales bacterium]
MYFNFPTLKALPADTSATDEGARPIDLKALLDQVLLERVTPVTVLANPHGEILYTTGRTGQYLEPPVGHASLHLFVMAREGLREVLPGLCRQAQQQPGDEPVLQRGVRVRTNGSFQRVDIAVHDLKTPEPLRGMLLVVFQDAPEPRYPTTPCPGGRRHPAAGAGGTRDPASARGAAEHPRADADLPGGAEIGQRGIAVHQ